MLGANQHRREARSSIGERISVLCFAMPFG
jgi:hypothetical protein